MASHLEDIGFVIKSNEEFAKLVNTIVQKEKPIVARKGLYKVLSTDQIQIWLLTRGELVDEINPYFEGKTQSRFRVTEIILEENTTTKIYAWGNPEENGEYGETCLVFEVPNFWLISDDIEENKIYEIKMTAFAESIKIYKDEKDFRDNASKNKEAREFTKGNKDEERRINGYAPNYFIPVGTFSISGKDKKTDPIAMFAGKIKKVKLVENKITKNKVNNHPSQTGGICG